MAHRVPARIESDRDFPIVSKSADKLVLRTSTDKDSASFFKFGNATTQKCRK